MEIVQDNLNFINGVHVLETPEDIIINSQVYDKETFDPKPFEFFNLDLVTNNNFNRRNILFFQKTKIERFGSGTDSHAIAKEANYKYFIQDTIDSSIIYYLDSEKTGFFHKIKKDGNKYIKIKSISPISGYYQTGGNVAGGTPTYDQKILGQTNTHVILYQEAQWFPTSGNFYGSDNHVTGTSGGWSVNTDGIISCSYVLINKESMSSTFINVQGGLTNCNAAAYFLTQTNDCVYAIERFNTIFRIVKISSSANKRTVLHERTCQLINCDVSIYNDNFCTLFANNNKVYLIKFKVFDNSVQIISETETDFPVFKDTYDYWLLYSIKICDDKYFNLTVYQMNIDYYHYDAAYSWYYFYGLFRRTGGYSNPKYFDKYNRSNAGRHKYHIFKYNEDENKYTYTSYVESTTQHLHGVLHYSNYISIVLLNNGVVFYKLNPDNGENNKILELSGNYETIGLDQSNNIYIFDSNNKCTIYNVFSSKELNAVFETEEYIYDDNEIDSYINIYSKNFLNDYIETKVEISLEGNCIFKENNKQTLITYTQKDSIKQIPITITNGGIVYCYIKEVK